MKIFKILLAGFILLFAFQANMSLYGEEESYEQVHEKGKGLLESVFKDYKKLKERLKELEGGCEALDEKENEFYEKELKEKECIRTNMSLYGEEESYEQVHEKGKGLLESIFKDYKKLKERLKKLEGECEALDEKENDFYEKEFKEKKCIRTNMSLHGEGESYEQLHKKGKELLENIFKDYKKLKERLKKLESEVAGLDEKENEFKDLVKKLGIIIDQTQLLEYEKEFKEKKCVRIEKSSGKKLLTILGISGAVAFVVMGGVIVRLIIDKYKK